MKLYHVSLKSNLKSIMENGLIPQIGERSIEIGEKEKAVYLFPTIHDMECALGQWLGDWYNDEYGEDIPLMSLEINLPNNFPIEDGEVEYEKICKCTIPPEYIKYLKRRVSSKKKILIYSIFFVMIYPYTS